MQSLRDDMFKRMDTSIDDVFVLMTKEEQIKLEELSLRSRIASRRAGIYRGIQSFERLKEFEKEMIYKYYTQVNK
jgi:hypothetical protein